MVSLTPKHPALKFPPNWLTFLIIYLYCNVSVTELAAQTNCDPTLARLSTGPLGYKDRGNRCEGVYIKEVGSTSLQVVSFTGSFGQYDIQSNKPLIVEWAKPPNFQGIHLRAQGLKRKLYYRMDSSQPADKTTFNWSTNVLASLKIEKNDIGIVGIARYLFGSVEKDIYVPLHVRQEGKSIENTSYNLVILPGTEMTEIFISLATVAANGEAQKFIKDGEQLKYGYYPAERSIYIPIPELQTGIYYLEIGATARNGGTSTAEIYFFYPAN